MVRPGAHIKVKKRYSRRILTVMLSLVLITATTVSLIVPALATEDDSQEIYEEQTENSTADIIEESADLSTEEIAQETTQEFAEQTVESTTEETTEQAVESSSEIITLETAELSTLEIAQETVQDITVQTSEESTEETVPDITDTDTEESTASQAEGHVHDVECFKVTKTCSYGEDTDTVGTAVLICGQEESEGVHQHTEECWHIHTDECFETTLVCGYLTEETVSADEETEQEETDSDTGLEDLSDEDFVAEAIRLAEEEALAEEMAVQETAQSEEALPEDVQDSIGEEESDSSDEPVFIQEETTESENADIMEEASEVNQEIPTVNLTTADLENLTEGSSTDGAVGAEVDEESSETEDETEENEDLEPLVTESEDSLMFAPMMTYASAANSTLTITGTVTVDGAEPGSDNIFTFSLMSGDGSQTLTTAQNDSAGNITFTVSNINNGSYVIKQTPTDSQRASHPNMVFDEDGENSSVTVSGQEASAGADWLPYGSSFYVSGGYTPNAIKVWSGTAGSSEYVYGYCLYNLKKFPYDYERSSGSAPIYTRILNPDINTLSDNSQYSLSETELENIKRAIWYYIVNPPRTDSLINEYNDWDLPEGMVAYFASDCDMTQNALTAWRNIRADSTYNNIPSNFKLVLLLPPSGTSLQAIVTGYLEGNQEVSYDAVTFANTTAVPEPTPTPTPVNVPTGVTIEAQKTLDGNIPGANTFTFLLSDGNGNEWSAQNDASGHITFETLSFDQPGEYTYTVREKQNYLNNAEDSSDQIKYDETSYTVKITVGDEDLYDLSGDTYYSVDEDGKSNYYISIYPNSYDFPVYCIDFPALTPGTTTLESITYTKLVNPDSATLANYVTVNHYGDQLAQNLRKLFYYIEANPSEFTYDNEKRNLVYAATGDDFPGYEDRLSVIYETTVVPDDYKLVLFIPNDYDRSSSTRHQTLMGASGAVVQTDSIVFNNTYAEKPSPTAVSATINVKKTLDGSVPGNHEFTFRLSENGTEIGTVKNNANGDAAFSFELTEAGTHTYTVQEVNDGQSGITYDTNIYNVTVTLTEKDLFDLTAQTYYSILGNDYVYYVSETSGGTDFPVYSLDCFSKQPAQSTNQETYTALVDPDSATLITYVTSNRYGDRTAENFRKLLYYFETNDLTDSYKDDLIFAATTTYYPQYDSALNAIYAESIPDDYHLVVFVPSTYVHNNSSFYGPLLGSYGAKISYPQNNRNDTASVGSVVFNNKTAAHSGPALPETGGPGTSTVTTAGLLCLAAAAVINMLSVKRRTGGTKQSNKR